MAWARIDDLMPEHPKILALSDRCFRAYVTALCWCSRNLTDGYIPNAALASIGADDEAVLGELWRAKLWKRQGKRGWLIHDYLEYNPSRAEVLAKRQQKAEAGSKGGQAAALARATADAQAGATPSGTSPVPSPIDRSLERSSSAEATSSKKIPVSRKPPTAASLIEQFLKTTKANEQVAALVDLAIRVEGIDGNKVSGDALRGVVRQHGHGQKVIDALRQYVPNKAVGELHEYMMGVLREGKQREETNRGGTSQGRYAPVQGALNPAGGRDGIVIGTSPPPKRTPAGSGEGPEAPS
jgi:hypothetical protein